MGASTAHFLTKLGFGQVALVEKRKICGGSTQYSAAHVRQHYSNEVGIRLAVRGARMFANAEEELGGPAGFEQIGYMLFAPPEGEQALRDIVPSSRASASRRRCSSRPRSTSRWPELRARRGRARLLRADLGLREPGAHGRVARPVRPARRASRSTRAARWSGSRPPTAAWPGSSRATARSRPGSSSTPAARGAIASGRLVGRRLPDHVQPRARGDLRGAGGLRRVPGDLRRAAAPLLSPVRRVARCSSARAGRRSRSPPTPRRTTTGPTRRTCRRWCRSSWRRLARARADADAAGVRRHVRDRVLRRLRHHRGLVSDRRRGGARRLLLLLRRQRPRLQDRPRDRRVPRRRDRGADAADRHLEPLRRPLLRGAHVQLRLGAGNRA